MVAFLPAKIIHHQIACLSMMNWYAFFDLQIILFKINFDGWN